MMRERGGLGHYHKVDVFRLWMEKEIGSTGSFAYILG